MHCNILPRGTVTHQAGCANSFTISLDLAAIKSRYELLLIRYVDREE